MPKRGIDFETVRRIGLELPGVEEGTTYGSPALKIAGDLLACIAINKSVEPGTLAVRMDFGQRDALLAEDPETYYLTPHYADYPVVLVRLSRVDEGALRDLLRVGWRFVNAKKRRGGKRMAARSRGSDMAT